MTKNENSINVSYLINEIYPCLQGEGINLGMPSLLLRLQICNLRCTWCDTPFTHTLKSDPVNIHNLQEGQKFSRISLSHLIEKVLSFPQKHLILSGGEPTLQNIGLFMRELLKIDPSYTSEVESNGTRIPHKQLPGFIESDYKLFQWNISPKFSNAGESLHSEAFSNWAHLSSIYKNVFFKFVVREKFCDADLSEILTIIKQYNLKQNSIILMPEGTDINSQISNKWLHDECLKNGFRYTPRLHILLFGNLRGV